MLYWTDLFSSTQNSSHTLRNKQKSKTNKKQTNKNLVLVYVLVT